MANTTHISGTLSVLLPLCILFLQLPSIIVSQQVTAVTQIPAYSSLSPCAKNVIVDVIDDSVSASCPAGSPPSCFCDDEHASEAYASQISTNIINGCLTSASLFATEAVSVFSEYCVTGAFTSSEPTGTGQGTIFQPLTCRSVFAFALHVGTITSTASSSSGAGNYDEDQKIALGTGIGIGVPAFLATVVGIIIVVRNRQHH